ncbi:GNAT family N-acetyltransferase, partial [Staphylococcus aureus]|nr:GNAT family N-acetyltransferase [Staphylococcus aureus]
MAASTVLSSAAAEGYKGQLQVPHPSEHMWRERLTDTPGVKQLVACIDEQVVGHLSIAVVQRPRRSHVADFGVSVDSRWHNRGVASALMREMIDLCANWRRVERIELTVVAVQPPAIAGFRLYAPGLEGPG